MAQNKCWIIKCKRKPKRGYRKMVFENYCPCGRQIWNSELWPWKMPKHFRVDSCSNCRNLILYWKRRYWATAPEFTQLYYDFRKSTYGVLSSIDHKYFLLNVLDLELKRSCKR